PPGEVVGALLPPLPCCPRPPSTPCRGDGGRPWLHRVAGAPRRSRSLTRVIVATDDDRIAEAVTSFGGEVAMTRADHASGTDRIAEVAAGLSGVAIVVNLQGDEPEGSPKALDRVIALRNEDAEAPMATLATPIQPASLHRR